MTTGDRIRQLRLAHQMTQEELGAKVGVQKAAIYKYENSLVVNLKRSTIEKLAIALDTTPTYLMGMETEDNPSRTATTASLTPQQLALLASFDQLNEEGKIKAIEYIEDLVLAGRYSKDMPHSLSDAEILKRESRLIPQYGVNIVKAGVVEGIHTTTIPDSAHSKTKVKV